CLSLTEDADCTLIRQGDKALMIDTGEEQDSEYILNFLKENGVTRLDYMVITHSDKDHIGGANAILEKVPVGRVVLQSYENEKNQALIRQCEQKKIAILYPMHTTRLLVGGMQVLVYPPLEKQYSDENNSSLAVLVTHQKVNMFFPGDAKKKRTEELLQYHLPQVDLYQVAYHGRSNRLSQPLLELLHPKYAVVTAAQADEAITNTCKLLETQLFYTKEQNKSFISEGNELQIREEDSAK
ncbi:MAG: MBL fold metallo-hydrolase, partial [Lachnospiraceae bacterium]